MSIADIIINLSILIIVAIVIRFVYKLTKKKKEDENE